MVESRREAQQCGPMSPKLPPPSVLLDLLPDAVCIVDAEGRFLYVNASFQRIFGYAPDEVLGRRTFDLVHPDDRDATLAQAQVVSDGQLQRHFRNRYMHREGHVVDVQWSAIGAAEYGVRIGIAREITELRQAERELEHLARHDPLTGLPNRHHLQHELGRAMRQAIRTGDGLAVLYLDLDGFKLINDDRGHDAGDRILQEVANRLQQGLRQSDMVARVGGDEFVVLLPGCRATDAARTVADNLRARLLPPYVLAECELTLDASVGIACFPADGDDAETLLVHADRDMYAAKRKR